MPEQPQTPQYTPEQWRVLQAPRGEILVSASAGTGKTFLLTRRIVERIVKGQLEVQRLLVMTFTDQAARELRFRMEQQLREAVQQHPELAHLRRQLEELPSAQISTIHAFCLQILREFLPYLTDGKGEPLYSPHLQLLDGSGAQLLLQECVEECLQKRFSEPVSLQDLREGEVIADCDRVADFYAAVDAFGGDETGVGLIPLLIQLYHSLRSQPDGIEAWCAAAESVREEPFALSAAFEALLAPCVASLQRLQESAQAVRQARMEMEEQGERYYRKPAKGKEDRHVEYVKRQEACFRALDGILDELDQTDCWRVESRQQAQQEGRISELLALREALWERLKTFYLREIELPGSFPRVSQDSPAPFREAAVAREKAFFAKLWASLPVPLVASSGKDAARLVECASWISCSEEDHCTQGMLPALRGVQSLLLEVANLYSERKCKRNAVDFADYEHRALDLLRQPEIAQYYRERFQEIYVDEYQDTNALQEALIAQIATENVFRVGDLKQSIYGFRHARPDLFARRFVEYQQGRGGELAVLSNNFRSTPQILAGVNELFAALLIPEVTEGVSYRKHHMLEPAPGQKLGPDSGRPVSVHWIRCSERTEETVLAHESRYMGDPDWAVLKEKQVEVLSLVRVLSEARKRYRWSEMAVLVDTNQQCSDLVHKLSRFQIPVTAKRQQNWYDQQGILQAISLLQLLDNAAQDFPLLAILLSDLHPAGEITERNLAQIRAWSERTRERQPHEAPLFYQVFREWIQTPSEGLSEEMQELQRRSQCFVQWLSEQRRFSQAEPIHLLLRRIYMESPACARLRQSVEGQEEASAWEALLELAESFEQNGLRGVHAFLNYYEQLSQAENRELEWIQQPDAVTILTHHSSKGLEFPLVCILDLGHDFRRGKRREELLFDSQLGIAFPFVDRSRGLKMESLRVLAQQRQREETMVEEKLRLFYVALTRAKEELHLFTTVTQSSVPPEILHLSSSGFSGTKDEANQIAYACMQAKHFYDFLDLGLSVSRGQEWENVKARLFATAENSPDWVEEDGTRVLDIHSAELSSLAPVQEGAIASGEWQCIVEQWLGEGDWIQRTRDEVEQHLRMAKEQDFVDGVTALSSPIQLQYQIGWGTRDANSLFAPFDWTTEVAMREESEKMIPSKTTVSEVKRRIQNQDQEASLDTSYSMALQVQPLRMEQGQQHHRIGAAERGTLLHDLLYHLPFHDWIHVELPEYERVLDTHLQRLVQQNFFPSDWQIRIPEARNQILDFLKSTLFQELMQVLQGGGSYYKEQPFSMVWPAGSRSLIQGRIDLWYTDGTSVTLVDYKSDRLPGDFLSAKRELESRYRIQLSLYAQALTLATQLPVGNIHIWSLSNHCLFTWPGTSALLQPDSTL